MSPSFSVSVGESASRVTVFPCLQVRERARAGSPGFSRLWEQRSHSTRCASSGTFWIENSASSLWRHGGSSVRQRQGRPQNRRGRPGGTNTKEHKGIKGKRATFKSDFNTTRTATATSCVKLGLLLSPTSREIQWIARNKPGQGWSLEVRKLYSDILSNWNKIQQDLTKRRWSKPPSGTVEGICGNICIASKRAKETQSKHPRFTAKLHNKSCTFPTFFFLSTTDEEEKWVMSDQACLPWSWNPTVSFQMRRVIPSVEEGCKRCLWRGTRVNVCRFDCITGCEADWKYTTKIQRNMCTNIIRTRFCNINP